MGIKEVNESVVVKYTTPINFATKQLEVFWTADEITVEKDVQSILVDMTESERHGVLATLRLFTLYELRAGGEYWGDRFIKIFPRHEFRRMASVFSMFELAVHAPFYAKLNEALNVSTDEFYTSYVDNPLLKERMEFIDRALNDKDDLYSVGVFSMVEGAVLYSSFAFLKHFQANGKNKLNNVNRGIAFSVRDEHLHAEAGAWCFKALAEEVGVSLAVKDKLIAAADQIRVHEHQIIDMIFEKGKVEGITKAQMRDFVDHRLDITLTNLGIPSQYRPHEVAISKWFYKDINNFSFNDFFAGQGREYTRNWKENAFVW